MSSGRPIRRAAVALALGLAGGVQAQSPNLDRAKLDRQVAEQKLAAEVDRAIADAQTLAKVSTRQAADKLTQALTALDLNPSLGSETRAVLAARLEAARAAVEGKPLPRPAADPNAAKVRQSERELREQAAAETKEVVTGLAEIQKHLAAKNDAAALQQAAKLQNKYPNNPVVQSLGRQRLTTDLVKQNEQDARAYQLAWLANQRGVEASAVPSTGDIQFPDAAKWRELTKARREQDRIKLTPKEESIIRSLDTTIGAVFDNRPFEEALQELSNQMGQEIHVDRASLADAGLDLSRRVTVKGKVTARTALRAMLQSMGLTFVVKDELIQVMTLERADRELTTRSYYLGDILQGGPFGNEVRWGPALSYQQTIENANMIVRLIQDQVDPQSWKEHGGRGTVSFHLPTMSIVVRGSTEVHALLGGTISGRK